MLVPTLWQRSNVDTFKCPSNVVWTSRQCCMNIVLMLYFNQNPNVATMLSQCWLMLANIQAMWCECCGNVALNVGDWHWDNIPAMLGECCLNVSAKQWEMTTFGQHCVIVVATLLSTLATHIEPNSQAMLCECCVNVVWTLVPNFVRGQFRCRVTVSFKFEFSTRLQHQHASLHWHNHIYKHLWVNLPTMSVELIGRWWIFKKFPQ